MSADFSTLKVKKRKKKRFVITDFKNVIADTSR